MKFTLETILLSCLVAACWLRVEPALGNRVAKLARKVGLGHFFASKTEAVTFEKEYDVINDYLNEKPELSTPEDILNAVIQWKNELIESESSKKSLVKALDQLTALKRLDEVGRLCRGTSGLVIETNNLAAGDVVEKVKNGGLEQIRPIDRLVYHYAVRHSHECPQDLKQHFERISAKMPEVLKNRIKFFMDSLISSHFVQDRFRAPNLDTENPVIFIEQNPFETREFTTKSMTQIGSHEDLGLILNALKKFSLENKNFKRQILYSKGNSGEKVKKQKLQALFQEYLVNPCTDYTNWLNVILVPMRFDFKLSDPTKLLSKDEPNDLNLLRALVYFELCERFLDNWRTIFRHFNRDMKQYYRMVQLLD